MFACVIAIPTIATWVIHSIGAALLVLAWFFLTSWFVYDVALEAAHESEHAEGDVEDCPWCKRDEEA